MLGNILFVASLVIDIGHFFDITIVFAWQIAIPFGFMFTKVSKKCHLNDRSMWIGSQVKSSQFRLAKRMNNEYEHHCFCATGKL